MSKVESGSECQRWRMSARCEHGQNRVGVSCLQAVVYRNHYLKQSEKKKVKSNPQRLD